MVMPMTMRNFSAANDTNETLADSAGSSDPSIFASADYFKDVAPEEIGASSANSSGTTDQLMAKVDELMWMDSNDSLGATMAYASKDVDNLVQGIQTYGFSESLIYYESLIWDCWQFFAEAQGMGMGFGLIAAALVTRGMFAPFIIYSVSRESPIAMTKLTIYFCFSNLWV